MKTCPSFYGGTLLKSEGNSLLSERGSITEDKRTNTLLIQDTSDKLTDIRKVITPEPKYTDEERGPNGEWRQRH